jgi:thiosulfate/3-mercaptopyruvate sulfurtransferase
MKTLVQSAPEYGNRRISQNITVSELYLCLPEPRSTGILIKPNYKGFPDPSLLATVEEASKLSNTEDVLFIDTRNYWKYVEGHIPGAHNLELYAFHWVDTSKSGLEAFTRQMTMLISSVGIDSTKRVIFYQENSGYDAARGVWLLNYFGHTNAQLLDGGFDLWKKKKLPMSKQDPDPAPANFIARPDSSLIATMGTLSAEVARDQEKRRTQIVDTRSKGEHQGTFRRAVRPGHIPDSVNIEWSEALKKDGTFKDAKELRKLYSSLSPEAESITYCQSGYRAAHSWFVLKLLGFTSVRNYLGSWYEWGNNPNVPINTD